MSMPPMRGRNKEQPPTTTQESPARDDDMTRAAMPLLCFYFTLPLVERDAMSLPCHFSDDRACGPAMQEHTLSPFY